jgi:predicted PurR-regulated permease PerM
MTDWLPGSDRGRLGWWVFVFGLAVAAAYITYSLIGMVVIGVFGYYATRPIYRRLDDAIDSDGIAAGLTISLIVVPVVVLVLYTGFQIFQHVQTFLGGPAAGSLWAFLDLGGLPNQHQRSLSAILQNPSRVLRNPQRTLATVLQLGRRVLSAAVGTLVLVGVGVVLSYFLLERQGGLREGLVELLGGKDTVAYAYLSAVDEDLESVFFGNLVFVAVMSVLAIVTYWGTNLMAPPELQVPLIFVLGVLTGAASLIPLVVGKVVYVPLVAYLAWQARGSGGASLAFVGGALLVYFLVLDILPQTFIQPYITGQQLDMVMMMFGYVLGPILFGWYGFFLLPIVFVLMLEAIRIVLPELLQGEALTPDVSIGSGVGADPREARAEGSAEGNDGAINTD